MLSRRIDLNHQCASKGAYFVRARDEWWQQCAESFLRSSDIILLDVTDITQGTRWEINRITELGYWSKTVLVSRHDGQFADGRGILPKEIDQPAVQVHLYSTLGRFHDSRSFRLAAAEAAQSRLEMIREDH